MDLIEVDPKQFVTCRLCLEELGQFQIIPIVQQQIKYCYEIDVEPFDGLPQLICSKCKEVLNNFFTTKKTLCEKQSNFRSKIAKKEPAELCIQPQQNTVSSSQQAPELIEEKKKPKSKIKRIIDSSDSDGSEIKPQILKKKKIIDYHNSPHWDGLGYKKELVCTICGLEWPHFQALLNHQRSHLKLRNKYPSMFKKTCTVDLQKLDGKANISGLNNVVVHNDSKIIEYRNSLFYFVKYSKTTENLFEFRDSSLEPPLLSDESDSSDDQQKSILRTKKRKRSILSRSSNETLVLETNKDISDNEDSESVIQNTIKPIQKPDQINNDICISIDDSSDSDADKQDFASRHRRPVEAKLGDYKLIQGIISLCVNAHLKNNDSTASQSDRQSSTETQLKRKVLGIGRKIINRQGFNCMGLLRYMEHKNLGITWITKGVTNAKDINYIRILTKLRGNETAEDSQGWTPVPENNIVQTPAVCLSTAVTQPIEVNTTNMGSAVIVYCNSSDVSNTKLLNANPVANPKQLPRKLQATQIMTEPDAPFHNNEDINLGMPIITSTTSLAPAPSAVENQNTNNNTAPPVAKTNTETPSLPRIKVKPYSELMSERMLNSLRGQQSTTVSTTNTLQNITEHTSTPLSQIDNTTNIILQPNVWVPHSIPTFITPCTVPQISATNQLLQLSCIQPVTVSPTLSYQKIALTPIPVTLQNTNSKEEYVLLDTVELPNTRTNSPFKYLRNLLNIHSLVLLEPHEILTPDFICLAKFKVQFKQEPIDEPVVLCLSLHCSSSRFCFTVKDRNQMVINVNKISPNWQWEIIKIFRGDIVHKLLQTARKHSPGTVDCTNKFLCILKSISFQKLT